MSCNNEPSARREGVLRGRTAFRAGAMNSVPPPKPTSLGTFLFGDKKVPRRRQPCWSYSAQNGKQAIENLCLLPLLFRVLKGSTLDSHKRCLFSDSHDILKTKASLVFSDMDNGLLCFCQNSPCFYFCWLSQAPWQVPAWGQQPQPACLPFFLLRYILPKMLPTIKLSTMRTTISPDVIFMPPYTPTLTLVSEYLFSRRIRYSIPASTATATTVKMLRVASPVNRPPIW